MAVTFKKKTTLIFISVTILFIYFGFIHTADAQTYYATGTLASKNLFSPASDVVGSIDYFGYNCTTTATTTLKVQFSQDGTNWYSATHTAGVWNTLSDGDNLATSSAISLSSWSAEPYFYYKMQFETSDTSTTPVLDEIRVHWTQGTAPTVTTTTTSPIYVRSAVANGNVTDDGGGIVTTRGFKYGLTETDTWSVSETGSFSEGAYSLDLTELDPDTTYYIRAYAINGKGTSYGAYVSFTTNVITYYSSGTLISKNIFSTSDVVGSIDYFGYNCTTTATTTLKVQFSQDGSNWYSATHTVGVWNTLSDGDHLATGDAISLSGWSAEPNFYYKMQFETSDTSTTPVLDEIRVHWTQGTVPTVTTATTTLVYVRVALANGNVTDDGGGIITTRGFKYGLTETDTWDVHEDGSFSEGAYSLDLTELDPDTTYYIRAYAINGKGTSYGSWLSFTTEQLGYYSSGTLVSKNLFSGEGVVIINNFYTSSTVPAGTTLWLQLSTTSQTWYSVDGVQDAWTFVSDGQVKFILYNLNWSGSNFYYKMKFEANEANLSPVLDEIILNYNLFHSPYLKGSIRIKGGVILK